MLCNLSNVTVVSHSRDCGSVVRLHCTEGSGIIDTWVIIHTNGGRGAVVRCWSSSAKLSNVKPGEQLDG